MLSFPGGDLEPDPGEVLPSASARRESLWYPRQPGSSKEIGFLETMESEGFVKKFGASWHSPAPESEFAIWFKEFPQPGVDQDYT